VAGKRKPGSVTKTRRVLATESPGSGARTRRGRALIPGAEDDDLAEELGEESVEAATSGQSSAEDNLNAEVPEETGGPFVETTGETDLDTAPTRAIGVALDQLPCRGPGDESRSSGELSAMRWIRRPAPRSGSSVDSAPGLDPPPAQAEPGP